jgi:hypothetical protein
MQQVQPDLSDFDENGRSVVVGGRSPIMMCKWMWAQTGPTSPTAHPPFPIPLFPTSLMLISHDCLDAGAWPVLIDEYVEYTLDKRSKK